MDKKTGRAILFAYGSLRVGEYNYLQLLSDYGTKDVTFLGTGKIEGFNLFAYGAYPIACPAPTLVDVDIKGDMKLAKNPEIVVDVIEVSNKVLVEINQMERGAGYYPLSLQMKNMRLRKGKVVKPCRGIMYVKSHPLPLVKSGDWTAYQDEKSGLSALTHAVKAGKDAVSK